MTEPFGDKAGQGVGHTRPVKFFYKFRTTKKKQSTWISKGRGVSRVPDNKSFAYLDY